MFDRNSDYALNKKDPDAIVCKSSTGVHIRLTRLDFSSQEEFEKRMAAAMEKIYEKAAQLGGKVSGEHGIGFAKKPYLRESLDPETIELMSGIKKAFDPKNILNPHKVFQS